MDGVERIPGWRPDPAGHADLRWWDGHRWTDATWSPQGSGVDPVIAGPDATERAHLDYLRRYLLGASARGVISQAAADRLDADVVVWRRVPELPAPSTGPVPAAAPQPVGVAAPALAVAPLPPGAATAVPRSVATLPPPPSAPLPPPPPGGPWAPREPFAPAAPAVLERGTTAAWFARVRHEVSADLAVHGLADLGALLLFAGLFGLVAFAFGQVRLGLRPVAEVAIPLTLFGAGWFLRRHGTRVVGEALIFLGGLLLPVVVVASLTDAAPIPPDLEGTGLALSMAVSCAAIGGAFWLLVRRRADSPLRFLVAPMGWLAVASAALLTQPSIPVGAEVVSPGAMQWALVTVAVALTILVADRGEGPLARSTVAAAWVGLPAAYAISMAAAVSEGLPWAAVVVAGAGLVVGADRLLRAVDPWLLAAVQVGALVMAGVAVGGDGPPAVGAALVGLGALALAEWHARRTDDPGALGLLLLVGCGGVVGAQALALEPPSAPWAAVAVGALAWAWVVLRHRRPMAGVGRWPFDVAIVALPLVVAPVASEAWTDLAGVLGLALLALAAAVVVRATDERERGPWPVAISLWAWVVVVVLTMLGEHRPGLALVGAVGAIATFGLAPRHPAQRVWGAGAAGVVALLYGCAWAGASGEVASLVVLAVGAVAVVAAEAWRRGPLLGHVVAAGELTILGAGVAALGSWGEDAARMTWTGAAGLAAGLVGWAVVAVAHEVRWSNLTDLLLRITRPLHWPVGSSLAARVPLALSVLALPAAVASTADAAQWPSDATAWIPVLVLGFLLALAPLARLAAPTRRGASMVLAHLGLAVMASVALLSIEARGPATVAAWSLVAFVALVGPARRSAANVSVALLASWAGTSLLAFVGGVDSLQGHLLVSATWGSVATVGGLAWDEWRAGPRTPGSIVRLTPAIPAVAIGSVVAVGAELLALGWWPQPAGASSLVLAVAALAVALELRRPWASVVTWALGLLVAASLVPVGFADRTWGWVAAAAVLLLVAEGARDLAAQRGRGPWHLPPFAVAHGSAAIGLAASIDVGWVPATWLATAALSLVVAARIRRVEWALAAVPLTLVGAGAAGPGWLALALAVTAALAVVVAVRTEGAVRHVAQAAASVAAAGAWSATVAWQGWALDTWTAATALGAASAALAASCTARLAGPVRFGRDWWLMVAVPTSGAVGVAVVASWPSEAGAGGALLLALAVGLAARPLDLGPLRDLAAGLALVAAADLLGALDASPTVVGWSAIALSVLGVLGLVLISATRRGQPWDRPAWVVVAGALSGAWLAALVLPEAPVDALVVAALLVTGLECAAVGTVRHVDGLVLAAPAWFAAAWLAGAQDLVAEDPNWATVPVGVAVLATVALARAQRRATQRPVAPPGLVALEWSGMALLAAPPLVATATQDPRYAAIALAVGIGLAVWGVLTRVRRRLLAGVVVVLGAVLLLLVVPLVDDVPELRGPAVWLAIAAVGGLAIGIAAALERGREVARTVVARLRERTAGWE